MLEQLQCLVIRQAAQTRDEVPRFEAGLEDLALLNGILTLELPLDAGPAGRTLAAAL